MKYKTYIKLVHGLYWCMFPIRCEELRINHLTPLFLVTIPYTCWFLWWADCIEDFKWRLHFQFGVEGLFWERYILKGQIAFEGHWRLQSWTLARVNQVQHSYPGSLKSLMDKVLHPWGPKPTSASASPATTSHLLCCRKSLERGNYHVLLCCMMSTNFGFWGSRICAPL